MAQSARSKRVANAKKSRATNGQYPAHHVHPRENSAFIKDCMNGHLTVEGRCTFPSDSLARKSSGVMRVFGETYTYGGVFTAGFQPVQNSRRPVRPSLEGERVFLAGLRNCSSCVPRFRVYPQSHINRFVGELQGPRDTACVAPGRHTRASNGCTRTGRRLFCNAFIRPSLAQSSPPHRASNGHRAPVTQQTCHRWTRLDTARHDG